MKFPGNMCMRYTLSPPEQRRREHLKSGGGQKCGGQQTPKLHQNVLQIFQKLEGPAPSPDPDYTCIVYILPEYTLEVFK